MMTLEQFELIVPRETRLREMYIRGLALLDIQSLDGAAQNDLYAFWIPTGELLKVRKPESQCRDHRYRTSFKENHKINPWTEPDQQFTSVQEALEYTKAVSEWNTIMAGVAMYQIIPSSARQVISSRFRKAPQALPMLRHSPHADLITRLAEKSPLGAQRWLARNPEFLPF
jgi:hypothetical protein